jgi:glutathione reductase (NADPH)
MTTIKHFDLLVLGGGSGGLSAATQSASYGAKVALINSGPLGGTCVNSGCVPKKITWYAGQLAEAYRVGSDYGFQSSPLKFDFEILVNHRKQFIKKLNQFYEDRLQKNNIHYIKGSGVFLNPNTIAVNETSYTANHIIIATGCYPSRPNIAGIEFGIDSDGFFDLTYQPKKIAIIGGGYIAVELASMLNQLGSEVKLLVRKDKPLRQFDHFLSDTLVEIMMKQGIQFLPHHEPTKIVRDTHGQLTIHCHDKKTVSDVDTILFAIGRTPRTHELNLQAATIKTDDTGYIVTNKWETTNISHIYAIGDITGKKLLTPVAIAAGKKLSMRIFGNQNDAYLDYDNIPTVIFTHPPIGSVGMSEQTAIDQYGRDQLTIYQNQFNPLFYALGEHNIPSRIKLITLKESEKIIGCHIIGQNSDEILQGFSVAIKMGATKQDFDNTVAIHPTSAEELVTMKAEK